MANQVEQKVLKIIAEQAVLDVSDIDFDATLDQMGIDSLGLVEAVFAIEEAFDISVPFNASEADTAAASDFDISSVAAMIRAVENLVAVKAA